jgi:hypothetical protein
MLAPKPIREIPGSLVHSSGNNRVMPNNNSMPPDKYVQNSGGTIIKIVENLSTKVKTIIDSASEATTMYGVRRLRPDAVEPKTTGKTGNIQGARTVRMPAINETINNAIEFLSSLHNQTHWSELEISYL